MKLRMVPAALAVLLAGCGMHFSEETKYTHKVHVGDTAKMVAPPGFNRAWIAMKRADCYDLQAVMAKADHAAIEKMVNEEQIFSTEAGAKVKVLEEQYNERRVKVLDGAAEGKEGWVVFEWLKPLQPGDR
jgi:hypothetical protein